MFLSTGESAASEDGSSGVHEHFSQTRNWSHAASDLLGSTNINWSQTGHRGNHYNERGNEGFPVYRTLYHIIKIIVYCLKLETKTYHRYPKWLQEKSPLSCMSLTFQYSCSVIISNETLPYQGCFRVKANKACVSSLEILTDEIYRIST